MIVALVASVLVSQAQSPDSLFFYRDVRGTDVSEYFSNIRRWMSMPGDEYHSGKEFNFSIDYQNSEKGTMILKGWTDKPGRRLYAEMFNCISTRYNFTMVVTAIKNESNEVERFEWKMFDFKAVFKDAYRDNYISDTYLDKIIIEMKEIAANDAVIEFDKHLLYKLELMRDELAIYKAAADDNTVSKRKQKRNLEAYNEFKTKMSVYEKVSADAASLLTTIQIASHYIDHE